MSSGSGTDGRHALSRGLRRGFGIAVGGIVLAAATLVVSVVVSRRADAAAARSREVARLARDIGMLMRDRETGVRGYLLTHDPRSLAPDTEAGPAVRLALDSLRAMTADDARQHRRAENVARAIDDWESRFASPVRAGRAPLGSHADTGLAGKPLFDAIRRELTAFLSEEDRLYLVRRARTQELDVALASCVLGELLLLAFLLARYRRLLAAQGATIEEQRDVLESQAVELEMQTEDLQDTNAKLTAANDEVQAFAYSVAHDLRAPLRTVNGFAAMIAADDGAALGEEGRARLARIRAAATHAGQLIDGVLALARLRRDELKRSPVDLSDAAARVVEDLQRGEPSRLVHVAIQPGLTAQGDPTLLRVVLQNLLGNAWKFTGRRADARIEVGRVAGDGAADGGGAFFVRDNGAGFDPAHAAQLFGMFARLSPEDFPGTGIGLATVRRIVERHGGTVWAEARPNEGATFYFTIPDPQPNRDAAL